MNTMIFDVLGNLNEKENLLTNNLFLGADAMLSNKDISYYELDPIDRNIYIYTRWV